MVRLWIVNQDINPSIIVFFGDIDVSPTIWGYIYIYIYVYIILYNGDFMEYHNPQFLV